MTKQEIREIEDKISELQNKLCQTKLELKLEDINKNKKYVGKCYYREKEKTYMKIVSEVSSNKYRVECVEFKLPIDLGYNKKFSLSGDTYPDAEITCVPFRFRSVMANSLDSFTEITQLEFQDAMDRYYKELVDVINKPNLSDMVLTRKELK